ncbi:hypothetical protein evm_012392 [Chilo suppressalis]|nr:hypothetical protein evm_012392 [Chilo suppressalis]
MDMDENTPQTPTKPRKFEEENSEYVTPPKKRRIDTTKVKNNNKRLQKYKSQWEIEHGHWLTNDPQNEYNGKCKLCGITFTVASAGIGQIKQHLQTKQHASKLEIKKTSGLLEKFLDSSASTSSRCSDTENVVASELALTYHTVKHNLSYNSMDCTIKLNKIIYCNSATATAIHLARTKMEALVTEVLGPIFCTKCGRCC